MATGRTRDRGWEALAVAALLNAGLVLVLDDIEVGPRGPEPPVRVAVAPPAPPEAIEAAPVALLAVSPPGLPIEAVLGSGDRADGTPGARPRVPVAAPSPGDRPADRGGGGEGGSTTWTGRRDRASDAALRSRTWTSPDRYTTPRDPGAARAASPEAIDRRPNRTWGDRTRARQAVEGAAVASEGSAVGTGTRGIPVTSERGADDEAEREGATAPVEVAGASRASREDAFVDEGAAAVDVARRGATRDDRAVAAASDQRNPDPYDLTPPRSGGGRGEGVAGPAANGMVADGWSRPGTAAAWAAPGAVGGGPTYASRSDPYFIDLFRKLDRSVVYPRDLAVRLVSGRVVAVMTLRADGTIADVGLHASSGYRQFDDQVLGALGKLGKLPRVPGAVLDGRSELRVMIPYVFRNPMIQ